MGVTAESCGADTLVREKSFVLHISVISSEAADEQSVAQSRDLVFSDHQITRSPVSSTSTSVISSEAADEVRRVVERPCVFDRHDIARSEAFLCVLRGTFAIFAVTSF